MLTIVIISAAWLVVSAFALLLCLAARRTDTELSAGALAPVVDLGAERLDRRSHSPAA